MTPVKAGRLIVEVGGRCEFQEVQGILNQVAHKLPFPAKAVSRETLEKIQKDQEERERNNQNPWTFERIATANMLGIRKVLSPYDLTHRGGTGASSTCLSACSEAQEQESAPSCP